MHSALVELVPEYHHFGLVQQLVDSVVMLVVTVVVVAIAHSVDGIAVVGELERIVRGRRLEF